MALATLFALTVLGAGFGVVRVLGVAKGAVGLGLAPAAGLGLLASLATWAVILGAPPPLPGVAVFAIALLGLARATADRHSLALAARTLAREQRLALATLVAALVVPSIVMGLAFAGAHVPLSPHDGASHTEIIQANRLGRSGLEWYPPGLTALFGAWLQAFPWIDSADGAFELGLSLPLLGSLAVFGLGVAVWHDLRIGATAALLLGFTYVYPYFPELWSGWPLAMSLILVVGLWTISLEYLAHPSPRWAALAGLVLGGIVLVHGTEVYTLLIVLPVVLAAANRRLGWHDLPRHLALAGVVALGCAAPYLPELFHWAGSGGAYAVGLEDGQVPRTSVSASAGPDPYAVFAVGALGVDLPIRLVLLAVGGVWVFREQTGRCVLVIGMLFAALASTFTFLSGIGAIHQVYAATFPWGMHYRMFMLVAIAQVLLAGAGAVVLLQWLGRWSRQHLRAGRRVGRVVRLLVLTWVGLMTWSMTLFMAYPTGLVLGWTDDDASAMAWLRLHATAGQVLVNDGYADAGIWAPYKAGIQVLLPRNLQSDDLSQRLLVLDNVGRLDQVPAAAAEACVLNVGYVYRGARASEWDARRFPSLADLRAASSLEEVFSSGEAVVFRPRLTCPR